VSLSPTLGRNEKVGQHIRKKIHKPNALRFWVEGGVIPLYVGSVLILVRSPRFCPLGLPNNGFANKIHKEVVKVTLFLFLTTLIGLQKISFFNFVKLYQNYFFINEPPCSIGLT